MKKDVVDEVVRDIFKKLIVLSLIIIGLGVIIAKNKRSFLLGYLFGMVISMLLFKLLQKSVDKSVTLPPEQATKYGRNQYFIRMFISAVVLAISALADYLSLFGTTLGLLAIKVVIILGAFIDRSKS